MPDPNDFALFKCEPLKAKLTTQACGKRFLSVRSLPPGAAGYSAACDGCDTGRRNANLTPKATEVVDGVERPVITPASTREEVAAAVLVGGWKRVDAAKAKGVSYASVGNWIKLYGPQISEAQTIPAAHVASATLSRVNPPASETEAQVAMKREAARRMWIGGTRKPATIAREVKMTVDVVRKWCAEWAAEAPAPEATHEPAEKLPEATVQEPAAVTMREPSAPEAGLRNFPREMADVDDFEVKPRRRLPVAPPAPPAGVRIVDVLQLRLSDGAVERLAELAAAEMQQLANEPDYERRAAHADVVFALTALTRS